MMKFLNKDIKLAIFDLDGTLIDSTGIWQEIDNHFFEKRNMKVPEDYAKKIAHIGLEECAKFTKYEYGIKESEKEIIEEWINESKEMYFNTIPLKSDVLELLDLLKKNNVHIALATANSQEIYEKCLIRLGIINYFEFVGDVNKVKEGKNSPKLYNTIANFFNVLPSSTLVFEDIAIGLKTAFKNDFISVGVYDEQSINQEQEKREYSYYYVESYKELIKDLIKENN